MRSAKQVLRLTVIVLGLTTISNSATSQTLMPQGFSSILATSLSSDEGMELIISDLGPPPAQAENDEPGVDGIVIVLLDSDGQLLIEMPAQTLQENGFVYLRLAASTCELGMATCALTITDRSGTAQTLNMKPLGDRIVVRPAAECSGRCNHRYLLQQNQLDADGRTVDIKGHIDHGKTTLTAVQTLY
jgi:hypothetical protein